MAFSTDGKYMLTQTNGPDWVLAFWAWDKTKVLAHKQVIDANMIAALTTSNGGNPVMPAVYQVSYNPYDATSAVVLGKQLLKTFRYAEGKIMPGTIPGLDQRVRISFGTIRRLFFLFRMCIAIPGSRMVIWWSER